MDLSSVSKLEIVELDAKRVRGYWKHAFLFELSEDKTTLKIIVKWYDMGFFNKRNKVTKASDVFGITEAKAEELNKKLQHAKIDAIDMEQLAELLDLQNAGELGYKCYLYGREIQRGSGPQGLIELFGRDDWMDKNTI